MNSRPSPPSSLLRFFRWYCDPKIADYIEGDLIEVYRRRFQKSGKGTADLLFIIDVIFLLRPSIVRSFSEYKTLTNSGMYGNYFKTAFRTLWKNKGYSALNIMGLAIGMSVALLIGIWAKYQASFNMFHENGDNIAIVMKRTFFNNNKGTQTGVMLPLYDELKANYSEVKEATRLDWGSTHGLIYGDTRISKSGHFVDPGFLKMFTFPLVKGDVNTVLNEPYSIVITQSLATALFGDEEPMGKTVTLDKSKEVVVTGVMKDVPPNSTIRFEFLMPFQLRVLTDDFVKGAQTEWGNNFLQTMIQLNDGVTPEQFSARIEHLLQQKLNDPNESTFFVHPLPRWHLYNEFKDWVNTGGTIDLVRLFSIVGLLVLVIACINFINLSTARSEKRAKEVGVRKAIGSQRFQLIAQFLSESLVTALVSFVVALLIARLSLPLLQPIGFENISLDLTDYRVVGIAIAACVLTGIVAGWYPALYLSNVKTVSVLKGTFRGGNAANLPRKILVVSQFAFSIALIIATVVIFLQIEHARSRPLGYDPRNLISFYVTRDIEQHYDVFKEELIATGVVDAVSRSSSPMTGIYNTWDGFSWEGMDPENHALFAAIMVDYDYEKTSSLQLKEGRFFDREHASDTAAVVINEATARFIGYKDPVGKTIKHSNSPLTIIGVTKDLVMESPFEDVMPSMMMMWNFMRTQGFIRIREGVQTEQAIAAIRPIVEKINPGFPFDVAFTSDSFNRKFNQEGRLGKLAGIFAGLSVFISCLGLFGLASFMAERRTKEIGIRKVVGASTYTLWKLLSSDFVFLVIIACVISIPSAYMIMNKWLGSYAYRTDIPWWIPAITGIVALTITLLTVSYQTLKAANSNPVRSLRSE